MDDATSVVEAQALKVRLHQAWDRTDPESAYAARLVALAERAQTRHIRRAARSGDSMAQRWLVLMEKAATR